MTEATDDGDRPMTEPDAQAKADPDERRVGAGHEAPVTDYTVAISPRQLAGGFAILAAILVLIVRSRRRRGGERHAD
jgi:hypothetical protein